MLGPGVSNVTADSHNVLQEGRSRDELRERGERERGERGGGGNRKQQIESDASDLLVPCSTYHG